ncbi:MAG TPA: hypothetical protein VF904_06970 [Anaeromyxobacteraceae bacterium]
MTHTTHPNGAPLFTGRARLTTVRDVAFFALCLAIVVSFLAQVWNAPVPAQIRRVSEPVAEMEGA